MNSAQIIKLHIKKHYGGYYDNNSILKFLKNNEIDTNISTAFKHNGFDEEDNMAAFYYGDGSILVISSSGINASS
jgi:hypothetical protein